MEKNNQHILAGVVFGFYAIGGLIISIGVFTTSNINGIFTLGGFVMLPMLLGLIIVVVNKLVNFRDALSLSKELKEVRTELKETQRTLAKTQDNYAVLQEQFVRK